MKLNLQKKKLKLLNNKSQLMMEQTPQIAGGARTARDCLVTVNQCRITDLQCPTQYSECFTDFGC